jgi:NTE family protein
MAVDVGSTTALRAEVQEEGFAATYIRGLEIVMQTMMQTRLEHWTQPPILLLHPRVEHVSMFAFGSNRELIEEGRRATAAMLDGLAEPLNPEMIGIFPRRRVRIRVDRSRCISCGDCVARAPAVFRLDHEGRAEVLEPVQVWSPLDGDYVRNCPSYAISARLAEPSNR